MEKRLFLIVITVLIFLSSCKKLIILIHGAHQPKQENISDIEKFANKKNIPLENSAMVLEDSIIFALIKRSNDALLFDKNGYLINFNKQFSNQECGGNIYQFISGLDTITYIERDSNLTIFKESQMWVEFCSNNPFKIEVNQYQYDYYLAYYWNTFSGNPNHRNAVREIRSSIQNNKRIKVKLILVNNDIRHGIDEQKFIRYAKQYGINVESRQ